MSLALATSLFLFPLSAQEPDLLRPAELVYVFTLGSAEMGRETVTFLENGWSTRGEFDLLGQRKGGYAATRTIEDEGWLEYHMETTDRGDVSLVASFGEGELVVELEGGNPKTIPIDAEEVLFYDDLIWANQIDLGRIFAARDDAGELTEGHEITALTARGGAGFPIRFLECERTEQMVAERRVAFRRFKYDVAGVVEFFMVCTPEGLPVRIEIPSQSIVVAAQGFEDIRGVKPEPSSIVDSGPWRNELSKAEHTVVTEKGVEVKMRDGVVLFADVYRPEGDGKHPTVLARTPYNRISEGTLKGSWYARRGYVFVTQDVRGRFDSNGEWFPFIHETEDGSDTIDWIAEQPWSDGNVGMIGASYVGIVQWLAAKSANPRLKCIVPQVSPPDPQENFPYEGGALLLGAAWWAKVLDSMKHSTDWRAGLDWEAMFATLPLGQLDQALGLREANTFLDEWLSHPPHDVEFWAPASYQGSFDRMTVPALHISGWLDGDQPGALQNFVGMSNRARTEEAREAQYLVMGPWTHFFNTQREVGHVDFGDEAVVDLDARILRFFDRYLKGVKNGIEDEPHVHVFTMGSNRWNADEDWPLPRTEFTPLYLHSEGESHELEGDGRLALEVSHGGSSTTYAYDPHDLPELDVDWTDTSGAQTTSDQSDVKDRRDDLEFSSPQLASDCEIMGPITAKIYLSTDAEDTDVVCTLLRLTPKGELFHMCVGVQRLRYAAAPRRDQPVPPGEITEVEVDMWATGQLLKKGERLVLKVNSCAWPMYARNLNTLEHPLTAEKGVVANNTIHHSDEHPSHLLLPVVPREDALGLVFGE